MSTVVLEIREVGIKMNDLLKVLIEANNKLIYQTQEEFINTLNEIKQLDIKLDLDWDKGAGEEWARFIHHEFGKVYMLNSKIGLIFVRKNYLNKIPQPLSTKYKVVIVENYDEKEWYIDLEALSKAVTQIVWHTAKDIVDPSEFSLDDFYYATI